MEAWNGGFKVSSNIARYYALEIGIAASSGWITTHLQGETFGRYWLITPTGLEYLWQIKGDPRNGI